MSFPSPSGVNPIRLLSQSSVESEFPRTVPSDPMEGNHDPEAGLPDIAHSYNRSRNR
jgi:hypothetical protein